MRGMYSRSIGILLRTFSVQAAQAVQPGAAYAEQAAHPLVNLCAFTRQHRRKARRSCRLRLSARLSAHLTHLGKFLPLVKHGTS